MQYFELVKNVIDGIEFQHWGLVARDEEEYKKNGYDKNPLVISFDKIPKYKFNLSMKVMDENGKFHPRNPDDFKIGKKNIIREQKQFELENIDKETRERIKEGFTFDNHTFSLSQNAQLNWQIIVHSFNMTDNKELIISTKNDDEYLLTQDNLLKFQNAYVQTLNEILKEGRDKKNEILNVSDTKFLKENKELGKVKPMFVK